VLASLLALQPPPDALVARAGKSPLGAFGCARVREPPL
jgi:hypothetical protein